ncbi:MAG: hypothetical protein AAGI08_13875, partial [Bacteroidota bacterium]
YFDIPETHDDAILENVRTGVKAICKALGYDLNTVEFAVRDGIPYAIDFMNPAPDADFHSVGQENFDWIVRNVAAFCVKKAKQSRRKRQWAPNV